MRRGARLLRWGVITAPVVLILTIGPGWGRADEPTSRLGRLFRFGSSTRSTSTTTAANSRASSPLLLPSASVNDANPSATQPAVGLPAVSAPIDGGVSTPRLPASNGPMPRLVPQPRVSRAATESDPIVTRVAIGRSDDGSHFGMFLQVFADGTVVDSSGVHQLGREAIRPIVQAIESGELFRLRGHCGSPSADFTEQVYLVVYERSLGRLRANAFSYSGNPDGCDNAVRHLHNLLEAVQTKVMPAAPANAAAAQPTGAASRAPTDISGSVAIPLTPAANP